MNKIARELGRAKSAISRELTRNICDQVIGYLPETAHNLSRQRKAPLKPKLERYQELHDLEEYLKAYRDCHEEHF